MARLKVRDSGSSIKFGANIGHHINLGASDSLNPTAGMTFAAWIRPDVTETAGNTYITARVGSFFFRRFPNVNTYQFLIYNQSGVTNFHSGGYFIAPNKWTFVVGTCDLSKIKLYINGAFAEEGNFVGTSIKATPGISNYIGHYDGGASGFGFLGAVDEPRIWNRALTATEVSELYYNNTVPPTGLVAEHLFNEGSGSTVLDTSGYGNNGTITGATYTINVPMKSRKLVNGNLVPNGDFEYAPPFTAATTTAPRFIDGTAAGTLAYKGFRWTNRGRAGTTGVKFDTAEKHSGSTSLKISTLAAASFVEVNLYALSGVPTSLEVRDDLIPALPNTAYTLKFWMKTNYISGDSSNGATVTVSEFSGAGGSALIGRNSGYVKTTTGWTEYTISFTTNAATAAIDINPKVYGHTGTATLIMDAWFDDITLVPTTAITRTTVPTSGTGKRKKVNNSIVPYGDFDIYPSPNVPTTTPGRFIDGTAGGAASSEYGWSISGTGSPSAIFENGVLKASIGSTGSYIEVFKKSTAGSLGGYNGKYISVKPSTTYSYSFRMKTRYVSGDATNGAALAIMFSNASGTGTGVSASTITAPVKTTTDWTTYSGTFTTNAVDAYVQVSPRIYGHQGASTLIMDAWYADIVIAPATAVARTTA